MDWNWFFSSLSQSAAAIVGFFGAFIITKILSNESTFKQKSNKIDDLITDSQKVVDDTDGLAIGWYSEQTTEKELETAVNLLNEGAAHNSIALYEELNFSEFVPKGEALRRLDKIILEHQENLRLEEEREQEDIRTRELIDKGGPFSGFMRVAHAIDTNHRSQGIPYSMEPPSTYIYAQLGQTRESINAALRATRHQTRVVSDFLKTVEGDPESSNLIATSLLLITLLFYVGAIAPLALMPQPLPPTGDPFSTFSLCEILFSYKGMLLTFVAGIFTTIIVMFYNMNNRMKYSEASIDTLKRFTQVRNYSPHFVVMEENQAAVKDANQDA